MLCCQIQAPSTCPGWTKDVTLWGSCSGTLEILYGTLVSCSQSLCSGCKCGCVSKQEGMDACNLPHPSGTDMAMSRLNMGTLILLFPSQRDLQSHFIPLSVSHPAMELKGQRVQ